MSNFVSHTQSKQSFSGLITGQRPCRPLDLSLLPVYKIQGLGLGYTMFGVGGWLSLVPGCYIRGSNSMAPEEGLLELAFFGCSISNL
jgi:hypothetical protein